MAGVFEQVHGHESAWWTPANKSLRVCTAFRVRRRPRPRRDAEGRDGAPLEERAREISTFISPESETDEGESHASARLAATSLSSLISPRLC